MRAYLTISLVMLLSSMGCCCNNDSFDGMKRTGIFYNVVPLPVLNLHACLEVPRPQSVLYRAPYQLRELRPLLAGRAIVGIWVGHRYHVGIPFLCRARAEP
jgi:hypothetical protein